MKRKIVTGNSGLIRSINRRLIINTIMQQGSVSRTEIEAHLGLALPTVMRIVDGLLEEGLIIEVGKGDSSGGRKPVLLRMNPESRYFIGVTVARKLKIAIADITGNILASSQTLSRYTEPMDTIFDQIIEGMEALIKASGVDENRIAGVGIGTPGTMFKSGASIEHYHTFRNWADFDLSVWKNSGRIRYPVDFENLPKLGAMGELLFGFGRDIKDYIYVFVDHGIGAGVVIHGELHKGVSGVASEFGHTIIEIGGKHCYCGNDGCLEMYAAIPAIMHQLNANKSPEAQYGDFAAVAAAAQNGDAGAQSALQKAGSILGLGIGNLVNLYNPEMVILGGELADTCPAYVEAAQNAARGAIFSRRANEVPIVVHGQGTDSSVIGAVALAISNMLKVDG